MNIEPLELRIAPASVFRFLDVDSDQVTIVSSVGDLNAGAVNLFANGGNQIAGLDLGADFKGANITFTVKKSVGGDGLVNVGYIDAIGVDLGNVTIPGDLGNVDSGDGDPAEPALKSLKVRSIGRFGLVTGAAELQSDIVGRLGALTVTGNVVGALISVLDGADGTVGAVNIGASLIGDSTFSSGVILSSGDMGPVKIGRDVIGGSGVSSGQIASLAKLGSVTVGGSVHGGTGEFSGLIGGTTGMGAVKIARDLIGDRGNESGIIKLLGADGKIASVTIGGSIFGGLGTASGKIHGDEIGPVKIGKNVIGSNGAESGTIRGEEVGIASVKIGGALLGGDGSNSGTIRVPEESRIGDVAIRGSIIGGDGPGSGGIHASLESGPDTSSLGNLTIGGSLIAGEGANSGLIHSSTTIGAVKVGGDLIGLPAGSFTGGRIETFGGAVTSIAIGGSILGGSISVGDVPKGVAVAGSLVGIDHDDTGTISVSNTPSIRVGGDIVGTSITSGDRFDTGMIQAANAGRIFVSGSIIAGTNTGTGTLELSGGIDAGVVGSLTIKGSIVGNPSHTAMIDIFLGVGSLTVGGNVERALIHSSNGAIGTVKVNGDWIASSLAAGVETGPSGFFGDGDDTLVVAATSRSIAAITIGGDILGSPLASDFFGFVADEIGSFKSRGFNSANVTGGGPLSIETNDVRIVEV